jgi:site-specific DNA-methyltransferase (adenine-specific)
MEKMKMESVDMTEKNIEKIESLFPNCITEALDENGKLKKAINFEVLKQMLSDEIVDGDEAYEFTWVGKKAAIVEANKAIRKTLRPCIEESIDWDNTENLYIEGDNLEVLKLLQESYLGKVKMIYIDPPYNTGSDSFIYPDNYVMEDESYYDGIGLYDELGNKLFKENTRSNPRFHSAWISMMYSRLSLCRNLLLENGAIFIHIDEGELFNLKLIADEVFGAENFCNIISLKTKVAGVSGSYMGKSLQNNTEYILFYCKEATEFFINKLPKKRQELMDFIQTYADEGKSWKYTSVLLSTGERKYIKTILAGNGDKIEVYSHSDYKFESINKIAEKEFSGDLKKAYYTYIDKVYRTTNAQTSIRTKVIEESGQIDSGLISIDYIPIKGKNAGKVTTVYYKDAKRNMVTYLKEVVSIEHDGIYKLDNAGNLWDDINYNNLANEAGISFPNGQKPLQLLKRLIQMVDNGDGIVLDFFSGSSSTAHAVMDLNAQDSGNRKFIMIQLPEICNKKIDGYSTICDIAIERMKLAGKKLMESSTLRPDKLDIGFRVFKLDDTNMTNVFYSVDDYSQDLLSDLESNIKSDRNDLDLLFGCLLEWGLPLSLPYSSEDIDGCTVHNYNNGDLVACFNENIPDSVVKYIAKKQPLRAVFRDSSFESSPSKINVGEIFKSISPDTRVKVI